jgi:regulator of replication initiation timing
VKVLKKLDKEAVVQQEYVKLTEIFKDVEESKRKLVEGIIQETAYLKGELFTMKQILDETGMIRVNPANKTMQKSMPIANEYRRTINIYALNIKILNGILMKDTIETDDPFDEWLKEKGMNNE